MDDWAAAWSSNRRFVVYMIITTSFTLLVTWDAEITRRSSCPTAAKLREKPDQSFCRCLLPSVKFNLTLVPFGNSTRTSRRTGSCGDQRNTNLNAQCSAQISNVYTSIARGRRSASQRLGVAKHKLSLIINCCNVLCPLSVFMCATITGQSTIL